ncbi:hypothetical protein B0A52_00762 [Exophiala mesophila]|uniref:COP9 signalosome complex subunit 3 N-terminal helical repeats domain-containing protein n=1 Tax=Exophiala mesophila TaxID=212818 RepID=A0A438NI50_EXOME|nr:hypothetical protein B0A52_00762 [Exophiala mesophila]
MDKILEDSSSLTHALLMSNEEQYDTRAQSVVTRLKKLSSQDLLSATNLNDLNPSTHTLVSLFFLLAVIDVSQPATKAGTRNVPPAVLPEGSSWDSIASLLLEFDVIQVRYAGVQFLRIVDYVSLGAEQTSNYIPAIQLLHHVILRLDHTSSVMTSTHRSFVRLCLLAHTYAEAVDILDRPIYHVPLVSDLRPPRLCAGTDQIWSFLNPATGLTHPINTRMFLEYYLLGAMAYLAVRRYKDAVLFLDIVLSAPTAQNVASAVQVAAYKKWLMLGLIMRGNTFPLPKTMTQSALKYIRAAAKPYDCVVEAFNSKNIERLRAEIEAGNALWQEDENYGLLTEVYQAYNKFTIVRLGRTFAALPVADVAKRISEDPSDVAQAKTYLQHLISEGHINALLVQSESGQDILRFLPGTALRKSESEVEKALVSQTETLQRLLKNIHNTEHRFETTKEYVDFLKKLKKVSDDQRKSGGAGNGRNATAEDMDEDMMEEF